MKVTIEDVERTASLSMLAFNDSTIKEIQRDLDAVLEHVARLDELNTDGVEPTSYILKQQNILRDDEPQRRWAREEMLQNAPEKEDGFFAVPRVVQ